MKKTLQLIILFFIGSASQFCSHQEISGLYTSFDTIELELINNHYDFSYLKSSSEKSSDVIHIYSFNLLKGTFKIQRNFLLLYDSINNHIYSIKILENNDLLVMNKILNYNSGDTLFCIEKFYKNGKTNWSQVRINDSLILKTYYDKNHRIIKESSFKRKSNSK